MAIIYSSEQLKHHHQKQHINSCEGDHEMKWKEFHVLHNLSVKTPFSFAWQSMMNFFMGKKGQLRWLLLLYTQ